jgi:hypothetical protein
VNLLSNSIGIIFIDLGHSFYKKQSRTKIVEIFKRYLIASSVFAHDDVLVAAGVVDPLVASKIGLVLDGQAQVGSRVAGRSFFEFNSFRDQLESGRPNNPQTGVSLGSNSGPVGVVVT